jgi:hypothetical protein
VQENLHQPAWDAGAKPAGSVLKLDLDSTLIETYGLQKQGGKDFTYLHTRGYHPLLAVIADSWEVIHSRLREGRASSGRGASNFTRQALARMRRLGLVQEVVVEDRLPLGCRSQLHRICPISAWAWSWPAASAGGEQLTPGLGPVGDGLDHLGPALGQEPGPVPAASRGAPLD